MTSTSPEQMQHKKQQIIESAVHLIAKKGFQGLSMQKIANDAGVAAGTIYRYFKDKQHLIDEVRIYILEHIAQTIQKGVTDDMPIKERFILIWKNVGLTAATEMDSIMNRFQYESLPTKRPICSNIEKELFSKVDRMFNDGKACGLFKPLDNEILASLTLHVSLSMARKHAQGFYVVTEDALSAAIEASWDAIIIH